MSEQDLTQRLREIGAVRLGTPEFFKDDPEDWVNAPLSVVLEQAALSRAAAAEPAVERVRALHQRDSVLSDYCGECSDFGTDQHPPGQMIAWPCPTIQALGDAPEPEWKYEWGIDLFGEGDNYGHSFDSARGWTRKQAEVHLNEVEGDKLVRRRTREAGPWEPLPVGGERNGE